jgi:hypothetical protein
VQAKVRPAQIDASNIVHDNSDDIVSDIIYDIGYNSTNIVYDIDIRYRIPIYMKGCGLVVSYVYIVQLFYFNCVWKGYIRWTRSLQRNGKADWLNFNPEDGLVQGTPGSAVGNCPAGTSWNMKSR